MLLFIVYFKKVFANRQKLNVCLKHRVTSFHLIFKCLNIQSEYGNQNTCVIA